MSTAVQLRQRAAGLRRLAASYRNLLAHSLAARCHPDVWAGPAAEATAADLARLGRRLHDAAEGLARAGALLERRADALDALDALDAAVAAAPHPTATGRAW
jgi:hypothetical protein